MTEAENSAEWPKQAGEFAGSSASYASTDVAERLAGSVAGTVLPFAFHPDLTLLADPSITNQEELFFNAARLDRSMALRMSDYIALAKPRIERIAAS